MTLTIPLSGSDIRIFSNVRFTRDYAHIRWFNSPAERDNFFNTMTPLHSKENVKFVRHDSYTGIYNCSVQLETLVTAQYLIFDNEGKQYYCFIDNVEYVNDGNTRIYFTIDIIQTFLFDLTFRNSIVEREHTKRYLSPINPVVNTLDEGMAYGSSYDIKSITRIQPYDGLQFMVIVCKQSFHQGSTNVIEPSTNGIPQPFTYYIHPFDSNGDAPDTEIDGTTYVLSDLNTLLRALYNSTNMVENVVSMYITDLPGLNITYSGGQLSMSEDEVEQCEFVYTGNTGSWGFTLLLKGVSNYYQKVFSLGEKYAGLTMDSESKLMMSPYTMFELTDFRGNSIDIKPEYINGAFLNIIGSGSMGTLNKTYYTIMGYLNDVLTNSKFADYSNSLICNEPSQIPVISDYLSAFLQGNANSIQARRNEIATNTAIGLGAGVGGVVAGLASRSGSATGNAVIGMAQTAANGVLGFQSINAQLKDIANVPPNVNSQGSNVNFDYGQDINGVFLVKKQITPEYQKVLSDYFKMFGYKVNQNKVPNLKTRTHFNYIKMAYANVTANIPHAILLEIKKVFEQGTTLWHVNDMMNYEVPNNEI